MITVAESESDIWITTDTQYLALMGELWDAYCKDFGENWPCYNGTALYTCIETVPCLLVLCNLPWCDFIEMPFLFRIIFVVTHGEIFGHLGHTGPLTVKTKWRCRRCKEIRLQLSHKASQQVLLQHVSHTAETIRCHWSFDPRWVKISVACCLHVPSCL